MVPSKYRGPGRRRARGRGIMRRIMLMTALASLLPLLMPTAASAASTLTESTISTTIGTTNVTPMWGPQGPKIVYDGAWYYAVTLDGTGTQHPWNAKIWKSQNGTTWTLAVTIGSRVYQPPSLLLDSGNRLWLELPCFTGAACYPGAATLAGADQQYVYLQRLQFSTHSGDGSLDFTNWSDHSDLTTTAERFYAGLAIDPSRRYLYHAYSKNGWGLYFSKFDTWTNTETTNQIGSPGAGESYLYARIRPGTAAGEVWLYFNQTYTGQLSTSIFGVQLWRSTDYGATFAQAQKFMVASCPNPTDVNWCDNSDLAVDSSDVPHVLFYKNIAGVSHLYYWKGTAGSVTLTGSPVDLGAYDNHAQIAAFGSGDKFVFAQDGLNANNQLRVMRSTTGATWTTESLTVPNAGAIYSPNVLRPESGTFHSQGSNIFKMLLSSTPVGTTTPYSNLQIATYTAG